MKKYARLLFLITLFMGVLATRVEAAQGATSLASIRGVTASDIAKIKQIRQARPEGLTYGMMHSDESFIDEDGQIGGFTRLICERLSQLFGIKVVPKLVG
jgi:hypothetical protein